MNATSGQECKFIIHSRWLTARKGERVVVLIYEGTVVGLCNLSTLEIINYARTDPVVVWKGKDWLMGIVIGMTVGAYGAGWLRGFAAAALTSWLLLLGRVVQRGRLQRRGDGWLNDMLEYERKPGQRQGARR